jgi:hypothetical protein
VEEDGNQKKGKVCEDKRKFKKMGEKNLSM